MRVLDRRSPSWVFNAGIVGEKRRERSKSYSWEASLFSRDSGERCRPGGQMFVSLSAVESLAVGERLDALLSS
jgi:hypothetical protein